MKTVSESQLKKFKEYAVMTDGVERLAMSVSWQFAQIRIQEKLLWEDVYTALKLPRDKFHNVNLETGEVFEVKELRKEKKAKVK